MSPVSVPTSAAALTAWAFALLAMHLRTAAAPLSLAALAGSLILTLGLALASGRRRQGSRFRRALALGAIATAVAAAVAGHVALAAPARAAAADLTMGGGRAVQVDGTVSSKIENAPGGALRFTLDATGVRIGDRVHDVAVPVVVRLGPADDGSPARPAGLDLGSAIAVAGTTMLAGPGERAVMVVFATRGLAVREPPSPFLRGAGDLRRGFAELAGGLPGPGGGLLPGLAVGETGAVPPALDAAMKASSLSHLTAVSGANCAIVVALAFGVASMLRLARPVRIAAALLALAGFVVLVTPEPSVLRAATMATIALIALALDRPGAGMGVLASAVIVALLSDPWLAVSVGFALSTAATAGLLLLTRPLTRGLARAMPRPLAAAIAVPLAAQLACGPLIILIDPAVPVYGVIANMLAAPAAPVATIIGLAACLAQFAPPLAGALAWIAWLPASWIAGVAETFAALPGARAPWWGGVPGALALAVAGALVVILLVAGSGRRMARLRLVAGVVLACLAGVGGGTALLSGPLAALTAPERWSIAQCDVGQGDALLLRSAGSVALVDTGPEPAPLSRCLQRLGVTSVDLLVLTHFDLDHVGGVDAVLGRVRTVLHGPSSSPDDTRMLGRLARGGAQLVPGHAGMTGTLGAGRWAVHWPRAGSLAFPPGNDASIVLEMVGGDDMPHTLLLGDLSEQAQRALSATAALHRGFDVVKVAHHGSGDQSDTLYAGLGARLALIGVGADNDYGHPRESLLEMLGGAGMTIARSDEDGLVLVAEEEGELRVWRERPGP